LEKKESRKAFRKAFDSTTVSSANKPKGVSSAVLSALEYVEWVDDDEDEEPKATSKVKRAPFVVYEAKEDIETDSRSSKEATSGSPHTKTRKTTNVDEFRRNFDRDERPSAVPLALQAPVPARHGDDDGDDQPSAGPIMVGATAPLALQAPASFQHHGDDDGNEQTAAGAIPAASAVETISCELKIQYVVHTSTLR
jgi:hypothetical protein